MSLYLLEILALVVIIGVVVVLGWLFLNLTVAMIRAIKQRNWLWIADKLSNWETQTKKGKKKGSHSILPSSSSTSQYPDPAPAK